MRTHIGRRPPSGGTSQWEANCARCGSDVFWVRCDECEDGFSHHDCGDDSCCCVLPIANMKCDTCQGEAGWFVCMSKLEWCDLHPLPGREKFKRGEIEWFEVEDPQ